MSTRSQNAAAMKERLRQMSQISSSVDGPLPGLDSAEQSPSIQSNDVSALVDSDTATLPSTLRVATRNWRSQGITVYDTDDARLERLAAFFKARGIKFGRRGQISLLAGAGIASLERLLVADPTSLLTIVEDAMRERKGKSAAER